MYEMFRFPSTVRGQCAFPGDGLRVVPQLGEGFAIVCNDVQLAIIRPTRAYGSGGKTIHAKVIHASFLTPGARGQQVAGELRRCDANLAVGRK
jgi:hypothetical protein